MNYFHVPGPMLTELRDLLTQLAEEPNTPASVKARAVTARVALSGVNVKLSSDSDQVCHDPKRSSLDQLI